MKTLADFKRALTVGSMWRVTWLDGSTSTRPVHKVQSNGVYFALPDGRNSFLDFPKAFDFAINEHGQALIYGRTGKEERQVILKYERV